MRIWHDDVRPPPDSSWVWARTNDEAKELLAKDDAPPITAISLDHDLGLHTAEDVNDWDEIIELSLELQASDPETGLDLVVWMIENDRVPEDITIHSWNPGGASLMAQRLVDAGHEVVLMPYSPRNYP